MAGGVSVCPQMRMMRPDSRRRIVRKPVKFCCMRDAVTGRIGNPPATSADIGCLPRRRQWFASLAFHDAHEQFLEPVDLVAHAENLDALRSEEHTSELQSHS